MAGVASHAPVEQALAQVGPAHLARVGPVLLALALAAAAPLLSRLAAPLLLVVALERAGPVLLGLLWALSACVLLAAVEGLLGAMVALAWAPVGPLWALEGAWRHLPRPSPSEPAVLQLADCTRWATARCLWLRGP